MVVAFALCLWLLACTLFDLKSREVPAALTLPFLFAAVLWVALTGQFALALFVALLFVLADVPVRSRGFANGLQAVVFYLGLFTSPEPLVAGLSMAAAMTLWVVWNLEKMGGADAQVLMALVLLLGPVVLLPIAVAGGIQGLVTLLARRKTMPFMLSILVGTGMFFLAHPPSLLF